MPFSQSKQTEGSCSLVDPSQANLLSLFYQFNLPLPLNHAPTFLGVTFNRTLSFSVHVSAFRAILHSFRGLYPVSLPLHGPFKESHSLLYKAFLWSVITYASPKWFSFFILLNDTKLERLHREVHRAITGFLLYSL